MSWITRRARANTAIINRDGQPCTYTPDGGAAVSLNACILKDTAVLAFETGPREELYLGLIDSADVSDRPQKGDTLRTTAGPAYVLDDEAEDADGLWRLTLIIDAAAYEAVMVGDGAGGYEAVYVGDGASGYEPVQVGV